MRHPTKLSLTFVTAVGLCAALALCAAAKEPYWELKQVSQQLGPMKLLVAKECVRMDSEEIQLFVGPPKYTITIMNSNNKRYVRQALKVTDKELSLHHNTHDPIVEKVGGTITVAGLKAQKYRIIYSPIRTWELWSTDELGTPDDLNNACLNFLAMTSVKGHGFPLRMTNSTKSGRRFIYFDTVSAKHSSKKPTLNLPKEFKRVTNLVEMYSDVGASTDLHQPMPVFPGMERKSLLK